MPAQIKALYGTRNEQTGDYFIPRNLQIRKRDEYGDWGETGLFAYCECPTIDFSGDQMQSRLAKHRTGRISFRLRKNPKTGADARLVYYGRKRRGDNLEAFVVNDYTMSWEVDVGFRDIQGVLQDIIGRSRVPSTASHTLSQFTDSRIFQVSSLSLSFRAGSWSLFEPDGNPMDDWIKDRHMDPVARWFDDETDGTPSKSNPFLLSYIVAPAAPELWRVTSATEPPPEWFVPCSTRCTLSPRMPPPADDRARPQPEPSDNDLCKGTVNYIMRTFRPPGIGMRPRLQEFDGLFAHNLFRVIGRKAQPGGLDGLMVISAKTWNAWFAPRFDVNYTDIVKYLGHREDEYMIADGSKSSHETPLTDRLDDMGRTIVRETFRVFIKKGERDVRGLQTRMYNKVRSQVAISYKSLAAANDADDTKHAVEITVQSKNEISIEEQERGTWINGLPKRLDEDDPAAWELSKGYYVEVNFKYTFIMRPHPADRGSLELVLTSQSHLGPDGKFRTFERRRKSDELEWGVWTHWDGSPFQSLLELLGGSMQRFAHAMADFGGSKLTDAVTKLGETFRTSVILPAATVFMFKGLDVDENGNLYVGVAYVTQIE